MSLTLKDHPLLLNGPTIPQPGAGAESVTSHTEFDARGEALKLAVSALGAEKVKSALRKGLSAPSPYRLEVLGLGWAGPFRQAAEDRLHADAEVAWIDAKCPGAYDPPSPEAVRRHVGAALARVMLGGDRPGGAAYLVDQVDRRLAHLRKGIADLSGQLEALAQPYRADGQDLGVWRREAERLLTGRHELAEQVSALDRFRSAWLSALSGEAASVIDGAGLETTTEGLREALILARTGDGVGLSLSSDLADVENQLKALGATPASTGGGRETARLQAKHADILKQIDAARSRHQAAVKARAHDLANRARRGDVGAIQQVCEIATERASAFPDGFAEDLGGCALRAALASPVEAVAYLPL